MKLTIDIALSERGVVNVPQVEIYRSTLGQQCARFISLLSRRGSFITGPKRFQNVSATRLDVPPIRISHSFPLVGKVKSKSRSRRRGNFSFSRWMTFTVLHGRFTLSVSKTKTISRAGFH